MGKKSKEHRRKIEKRNQKLEQEKYAMKKQINKLFEQRLENVDVPEITANLGGVQLPSTVLEDSGIFRNTKLNTELDNLIFNDPKNDEVIDIEVVDENEPRIES